MDQMKETILLWEAWSMERRERRTLGIARAEVNLGHGEGQIRGDADFPAIEIDSAEGGDESRAVQEVVGRGGHEGTRELSPARSVTRAATGA